MTLLSKKRVLIVEDDAEIRNSFVHIVNSSDKFGVVNAYGSSEDAIKHLNHDKPDYVLMDIQLPGMSGIQCSKVIKDKSPSTEIIMVTVYEDNDQVFEALKSGATGYITKSSNHLELLSALDEISRGGAPMSSKIARSARFGARAITASSTARCIGSDDAGPSGREVDISKLVRSSAPSALLICTTMRLWQARSRPWWKRRSWLT